MGVGVRVECWGDMAWTHSSSFATAHTGHTQQGRPTLRLCHRAMLCLMRLVVSCVRGRSWDPEVKAYRRFDRSWVKNALQDLLQGLVAARR